MIRTGRSCWPTRGGEAGHDPAVAARLLPHQPSGPPGPAKAPRLRGKAGGGDGPGRGSDPGLDGGELSRLRPERSVLGFYVRHSSKTTATGPAASYRRCRPRHFKKIYDRRVSTSEHQRAPDHLSKPRA